MANVITYGVTLDATGAINGFKRLDAAMDQNAAKLTAWSGLASRAGAIAGTAIGTAAVLGFRKMIRESEEAQYAQAQLVAALKSTGGAAGLTASALNEQAAEMQRLTTFSDDAVTAMQSVLLTFTKVGAETFPRATRAIADLATRMGGDLQGAAVQVGKALNDPVQGITALTRVGVSFSDAQKEVIKQLAETNRLAEAQAMILKELETEFGGSAAAAADTLGGALARLSNAWGDLFEVSRGGSGLMVKAINAMTDALPRLRTALGQAINSQTNGLAGLLMQRLTRPTTDLSALPAFGMGTAPAITITAIQTESEKRHAAWLAAKAEAKEREGWENAEIARLDRIAEAAHRANAARLGQSAATNSVAIPSGLGGGFQGRFANGARITTRDPLVDNARAAVEAARQSADERMAIEENFLRGAQGAFAGFFRDVLANGVASFKDLMSSFSSLVVSTVAELAAKRLMERVFSGSGKAGGGGGGLLGFLSGPIGIAAGVFGIGAALAGRNRANNPAEQAYNRPTPWQAAEIDRLRAQNDALTGRGEAGNQLRQSVGGVLTETSASRIVGNLESIRVGIFRLVALAEAGAMGGATVTVNGAGTDTSPGASVAALVDRAMGVTTQRLRLAAGVAVIG